MSEENGKSRSSAILVIGGGISGMTVALEAAEVGREVYLVERLPSLGGRVAQMNKYFPKLCPPLCGLEVNYQRLRLRHDSLKVFTLATVENVKGEAGAFQVTVRLDPRYVNEKCTVCGDCADPCRVEVDNTHDYGMSKRKGAALPHAMAYPYRYALDMKAGDKSDYVASAEACKYDAINLDEEPKRLTLNVGAIVVATGWAPADASSLDLLGFGRCENVITNVMMERLASPDGPTGGKILRPSDGKPVESVIFVQCAGSRDANHLPYCSGICCLASLKQTTYLREQNPASTARVFYIDLRASGVFEDFLKKVEEDEKVTLTKGKVAKVEEDEATKDVTVEAEDILGGGKTRARADLVVLATGMTPESDGCDAALGAKRDGNGWLLADGQRDGVVLAGSAKGPMDVAAAIQDATGAALKAIQWAR